MSTDPRWDAAERRRRRQGRVAGFGQALQGIGQTLMGHQLDQKRMDKQFDLQKQLEDYRANLESRHNPSFGAFLQTQAAPQVAAPGGQPDFRMPTTGVPMQMQTQQQWTHPLLQSMFGGQVDPNIAGQKIPASLMQSMSWHDRDRAQHQEARELADIRHQYNIKEIELRNQGNLAAAAARLKKDPGTLTPSEYAYSPEFRKMLRDDLPTQFSGSRHESNIMARVASGENPVAVIAEYEALVREIVGGGMPLELKDFQTGRASQIRPGSLYVSESGTISIEDRKGNVRALTAAEFDDLVLQVQIARAVADMDFGAEGAGTSLSDKMSHLADAPTPLRPDVQEYEERTAAGREGIRRGFADLFRTRVPDRSPHPHRPKF